MTDLANLSDVTSPGYAEAAALAAKNTSSPSRLHLLTKEQEELKKKRQEMLTDMLATAVRYGKSAAMEQASYENHFDIPQEHMQPHVDQWLQQNANMSYDDLTQTLTLSDGQAGIDWAWSLAGPMTNQYDAAHMASSWNPVEKGIDLAVGTWKVLSAAGSAMLGRTDDAQEYLASAKDWMIHASDRRLEGYGPNPYGDQMNRVLGVHNWQDALWFSLDLLDIATLGTGGAVVRPLRIALARGFYAQGRNQVGDKVLGDTIRRELRNRIPHTPRMPIRDEWQQRARQPGPPGTPAGARQSSTFLGDQRLAPTHDIGEGVKISEIGGAAGPGTQGTMGEGLPLQRPFVVVQKADGSLQPFYRSTGTNSQMEGVWLPFDGFGGPQGPSWYRKDRFTHGEFAEGTPLHRFGSEENKAISELLGRELGDADATVRFDMEGVDTEAFPGMSYEDLNEALGTHIAVDDYLGAIVDESPTFTGSGMRQEGPPGTPEDWMYYTDRSGRKQYEGAGAFENPAGHDIQKVKDELGWTDDQFDQAKAAWANDPQRIEDQVAREAERLDMELAALNPDPTVELLEWSDLDPEVRDAIHKIADDLGRSLGEHAEGRNLIREVEEYLGVTGTPPRRLEGPPGTPEVRPTEPDFSSRMIELEETHPWLFTEDGYFILSELDDAFQFTIDNPNVDMDEFAEMLLEDLGWTRERFDEAVRIWREFVETGEETFPFPRLGQLSQSDLDELATIEGIDTTRLQEQINEAADRDAAIWELEETIINRILGDEPRWGTHYGDWPTAEGAFTERQAVRSWFANSLNADEQKNFIEEYLRIELREPEVLARIREDGPERMAGLSDDDLVEKSIELMFDPTESVENFRQQAIDSGVPEDEIERVIERLVALQQETLFESADKAVKAYVERNNLQDMLPNWDNETGRFMAGGADLPRHPKKGPEPKPQDYPTYDAFYEAHTQWRRDIDVAHDLTPHQIEKADVYGVDATTNLPDADELADWHRRNPGEEPPGAGGVVPPEPPSRGPGGGAQEGPPGTPYYHGTSADFEDFEYGGDLLDPGTWGSNTPNPDSGLGFHFSTSSESAEFIGPNIMERRLRLENPLEVPDLRDTKDLRTRAYISELGLDDLYEESYQAYRVAEGLPPISDAADPASRLLADIYERTFLENWRSEVNRAQRRRIMERDYPQYARSNEYISGSIAPNLDFLTDEQHQLYSELTGGEVAGNPSGVGTRGDEITREWLKSFGYDGLHIREAFMGPSRAPDGTMRYLEGLPEQASWVVFDPDQISKLEGPPGTPTQQEADEFLGIPEPGGYDIEGKPLWEAEWQVEHGPPEEVPSWMEGPPGTPEQTYSQWIMDNPDYDAGLRNAEEGGWSEELKAKRQQEYLDEIRLDPESFWEETPHGTASLAELGWMSWQQLFDVMRNTQDSLYDFAQEEFMQRYNLLRKLRDEGRLPPSEGTGSLPLHEIDKANIERFLRHFPDGTYPPETFEDLLVASMDPDLRGTSPIPRELVDSVSEIAREMDEWWEDSTIRHYQQRQQGPPGTPE